MAYRIFRLIGKAFYFGYFLLQGGAYKDQKYDGNSKCRPFLLGIFGRPFLLDGIPCMDPKRSKTFFGVFFDIYFCK